MVLVVQNIMRFCACVCVCVKSAVSLNIPSLTCTVSNLSYSSKTVMYSDGIKHHAWSTLNLNVKENSDVLCLCVQLWYQHAENVVGLSFIFSFVQGYFCLELIKYYLSILCFCNS